MASTCPEMKHEVYLSFKSKDIGTNFIGHLNSALTRNCISAALTGDDDDDDDDDRSSDTLFEMVSESRVSVIILSQGYGQSPRCLDELVRIMECRDSSGQVVLPVFFGVRPTHVREQSRPFGDGFHLVLQDSLLKDREEAWRRALVEVANLSGWDCKDKSEDKIVAEIVNRIEKILDQVSLEDQYDGFVGYSRVEKVESLLSLASPVVGIWGMGGIGKTAIARVLFYRLANRFDGACFIENVRAKAEREGLDSVRSDMILQLFGGRTDVAGPYMLSPAIRRKLGRQKLLVVLDDLDDPRQLNALVGRTDFCHHGSKVVVTSRDKQVLKNASAVLYEVEKLSRREALLLFRLHAFRQDTVTEDLDRLSNKAADFAKGLPLALEVLGCNLYGRNLEEWEMELSKLQEIPDVEVTDILRNSYDGLDPKEKNIFLDIACIFQGWVTDRLESILDGCGFHAGIGLSRLLDKALITIAKNNVWMHDLLQQMGQDIVDHECIEDPGKRSRLWRWKDVNDVLTRETETEGTRNIEVISMDLPAAASIKLRSRVFKKMTGLRILKFHNGYPETNCISVSEGLKYLPDKLRYLEWDLYPLSYLPSKFNPEFLVELLMINSHLIQLWTSEEEPCLPSLKCVNLTGSKNLMTLPYFRNALKLQTLSLSFCENLKSVPDSMQHLVELKNIHLYESKMLTRFPEISKLNKLEKLWLVGCSEIRNLPELPRNLISLNLCQTNITELPASFQGLSQLKELMMHDCKELEFLPEKICELKHLKDINLSGCSKLLNLPADLGDLESLQMLVIEGCPLSSLPASIDGLRSLTELCCSGYRGSALPSLKSLVSLRRLYLRKSFLKSLPEDVKYLTNLSDIYLSNSKSLSCIPELPASLHQLDASNCTSLLKYTMLSGGADHENFVRSAGDLGLILHLDFSNCFNLEQDARKAIWRDFWLRVQIILVPSVEEMYDEKRNTDAYQPSSETEPVSSADVCIPGNEVPELFKNSKIGSSLQVKTNNRRRSHPFQFIFCAVIAVPHNLGTSRIKVTCKCLTKTGETLCSSRSYAFEDESIQFQREHTVSWFDHFGPSQFYCNKTVFQFSAEIPYGLGLADDVEIVKCGVTPIGRMYQSKSLPVIQDGNSSVSEESATLIKRPQKRERENGEEGEPHSHKRNNRKLGRTQRRSTGRKKDK